MAPGLAQAAHACYNAGVIVPCPLVWSPVQRAIGWDPGAPSAHWAALERVESGPEGGLGVRVLGYGSVEWRGSQAAHTEIVALFNEHRPQRLAVEDQFLNYGIFAQEDPKKRAMLAGSFFKSLKGLAQISGGVSALWSAWAAGREDAEKVAWSVPHGTWKACLAPAKTSTQDDARAASLALAEQLCPGGGPGRKGVWRKGDHDLAAAIGIALVGLGVSSAQSVSPSWPPSGVDLRAVKRKRKARKKSDKKIVKGLDPFAEDE